MEKLRKNPLISVITCVFNGEKYLDKCLHSVETQKYKNIEHIFNYSNSSDNSLKLINEYIERNQDEYPIKFMESEAKGIGNALNTALGLVSGDIVHYLHSDDYYADKNSLKRAASYFDNNPETAWLTGNFMVEVKGKKVIIPQTHILKANPQKALSAMNIIHHENTFVRSGLIEQYGGFEERENVVVEYGLWLRMLKDHQLLIVDDQFTVFIIHSGSRSTGGVVAFSKSILRAFNTQRDEKIFPLIGYYEDKAFHKNYKMIVERVKRLKKLLELKI